MYAVEFWNASKNFVDIKMWEYHIIKLYKLHMSPHLVLAIPLKTSAVLEREH
jgi:hypothetical protein